MSKETVRHHIVELTPLPKNAQNVNMQIDSEANLFEPE
jgi:hypothetical protein